VFTKTQVTISGNDNEIILQGTRDPTTNLWMIPVQLANNHPDADATTKITPQEISLVPHTANYIIAHTKIKELVAFAHEALFFPSISTLRKALDNNFLHDFPGLSSKEIRDHPPSSSAALKGHLDKARQNRRPTKHTTPT
jgi:hypothetical protein